MALGASTTNRKWRVEVNTGTTASPVWVLVMGRTDFQFVRTPTLQDDSDMDSGGFKSQTVTAQEWGANFKVSRKVLSTDGTSYDPGQEFLRLAASQLGSANSVGVRISEMEPSGPRVEAYSGVGAVTWSPDGGGMDALDMVSVTMSGQGQLSSITHPFPGSPLAPVISSLSPAVAGTAGGALIKINGSGFRTATSVTVGGVAVGGTLWFIADDQVISFIAPAKSAGSQAVIVINPAGSSPSSPLVYS